MPSGDEGKKSEELNVML